MKKIAWITDSSAYVPESMKTHENLFIIPMNISFEEDIYQDGIDLTSTQLYEKIEKSKQIPKTSQPAISYFIDLYKKLKEDYDEAIAVHLSSDLSGTYQTSCLAAEMAEFPVEVVDSKILSYPMTMMIEKGMELHTSGLCGKEIAKILRMEHKRFHNYILVGRLEQLYKGGRINGVQKAIGTLLKIHPILQVKNGTAHLFGKFRTKKRALNTILKQFEQEKKQNIIKNVQILHADVLNEAKELKEKLMTQYKDIDVLIGPLSPTIGVHGGKGSMVLAWSVEKG
ncbi:DegV family protein [Bacillus carboniphilus]|uniref:DegV family protein n=1 Tax=Bacillus carboniphilus TaxID=86663 RepID=A0ABY9JYL4_9BACI|nr:DegV family protein [Bacillus carboniphilus]WLR42680.1 DegV family protein [Bacillus carboniphilus]